MGSPPELITRYLDFGTSVAKQSVEGSVFGPVPEGAFEITYEQYLVRLDEIHGVVHELKTALFAADEESAAAAAQEASAIPLVNGPVTDDSYPGPRPPIDGSIAVDTVSGRLYVRVGGVWRSSALA